MYTLDGWSVNNSILLHRYGFLVFCPRCVRDSHFRGDGIAL